MVTIALSAHDVERWVWFTEGASADYAQMWLTLENEQTDNSGTSPVDGNSAWQ
jgi:pilus assembly protein CpaB